MENKYEEIDIGALDWNPCKSIGKDWALVTAGDEKAANTMTIRWGTVGAVWRRNAAIIFVRENRYTKKFVDGSDYFSISFFDDPPKKALVYLGTHSGRDSDKITEAGMSLVYRDGVPFIAEGDMTLICKKMSATPIPKEDFIADWIDDLIYKDHIYHTMYIGEITTALRQIK